MPVPFDKMNLNTERQVIRLTLILSIIVGSASLGFFSFSYSGETQSGVSDTEIVFSGFGQIKLYNPQNINLVSTNTYQDKVLGFQISKPNDNWEIHSVLDEFNSKELAFLESKGFVDGLFVEQEHDKRFILSVFDIQKENFSLHEYVDSQIELIEHKQMNILFEQVSPRDNWAAVAIEFPSENQYGEQILFLKENRLFMLQYLGNSPQSLKLDEKKEVQFIMESFEVI